MDNDVISELYQDPENHELLAYRNKLCERFRQAGVGGGPPLGGGHPA